MNYEDGSLEKFAADNFDLIIKVENTGFMSDQDFRIAETYNTAKRGELKFTKEKEHEIIPELKPTFCTGSTYTEIKPEEKPQQRDLEKSNNKATIIIALLTAIAVAVISFL